MTEPTPVAAPGVGDNLGKIGSLRRPSQQLSGTGRLRHENCWIAGPSFDLNRLDFRTGDVARHVDYLSHGGALPAGEICGYGIATLEQILHRNDMRARDPIRARNLESRYHPACRNRRQKICTASLSPKAASRISGMR